MLCMEVRKTVSKLLVISDHWTEATVFLAICNSISNTRSSGGGNIKEQFNLLSMQTSEPNVCHILLLT